MKQTNRHTEAAMEISATTIAAVTPSVVNPRETTRVHQTVVGASKPSGDASTTPPTPSEGPADKSQPFGNTTPYRALTSIATSERLAREESQTTELRPLVIEPQATLATQKFLDVADNGTEFRLIDIYV